MAEVEEPELIHFTLETRRPLGRRREVVQNEKATRSKELHDLLRVVPLAPAITEEHIEGRMPLKQPPVPDKHADPVIVCEHPSSPTGDLLVTLHGDKPGTGPRPTVQPGGTHTEAGTALRNDAVGLRGSGHLEQPAHLGNAALGEPRRRGKTLGSHHPSRNHTLSHDHEPPWSCAKEAGPQPTHASRLGTCFSAVGVAGCEPATSSAEGTWVGRRLGAGWLTTCAEDRWHPWCFYFMLASSRSWTHSRRGLKRGCLPAPTGRWACEFACRWGGLHGLPCGPDMKLL